MTPGSWVALPGNRVARIVEVDESSNAVLATEPNGEEIDRPLTYARANWKPIAESSILVRRAIDLTGVARQAADDPVGLVVAVIADNGGRAGLSDIRATLTPMPFTPQQFEAWWKNTQRRLSTD